MPNALDKEMLDYFTQLNKVEKMSIVQMLKTFLRGKRENHSHISLEQYNREIDEAMEEVERGDVFSHDEVKRMTRS